MIPEPAGRRIPYRARQYPSTQTNAPSRGIQPPGTQTSPVAGGTSQRPGTHT